MTIVKTNRSLVVNLMRAGLFVHEALNKFFKTYELTLPQFNVLRILRGQKGKPTHLSTINKEMIHKMSNTTRLIDKLIDKALVRRIICEKNRRKIEVYITDKGLELLSLIDLHLAEKEAEILSQIDTDNKNTLLECTTLLLNQKQQE
jgi:DNA-binding MarR family transcriptional regulator